MVRASFTVVDFDKIADFDSLTRFDFEAHLLDIGWLISWIVKELTSTLFGELNHCISLLNIL